jgi:cellulose synthase/poly-beta-1,6-N-acetylglucosamine synthase-like glycosyltransferase
VLQCIVQPVYDPRVPVSGLAALSELLEQQISNKVRARFGWPVRLRGTGMVIRPELLIEAARRLDTKVEDLALSLLFAARGIRIQQLDGAVVFDPKPGSAQAAAIQRARWFRGQCRALWQYRAEIVRVLLRGPGGWSLLSSLFLRPKWLVLAASATLALVCLPWPWLSAAWAAYFLLNLTYLITGLALLPERPALGAVLLRAPAFVWMWLRGLLLSVRSSAWHRTRR